MSKFILPQEPVSREQLRQEILEAAKSAQAAAQQAAQKAAEEGARATVIPAPPLPPGTPTTGTPPFEYNAIPAGAENISIAFFVMIAAIIIGLPIMRAIARRIERGTPVAAPIPVEVRNQLEQISQSVDAIALEVERISEGQRFTTKMLAERNREEQGRGDA
ncbi:MAG: hypothetical protein ACSLFK_14795 [Gemmatimonadaceae bacterium]